ncbi:hypothetical protein K488DRAFT_75066 [Vararia minispora EC-137]|uniref:Uncharacterized protein n=1 Tax=Vararia minispora EC-137 TaxID=1314806 RepID=A0ACB8Q5S7_9AGAM|nr:hypothetical protein K488DRAFT_75066 [Vararia minispora EC-137]
MSSTSSPPRTPSPISPDPEDCYTGPGMTQEWLEAQNLQPRAKLEKIYDSTVYERPHLLHYGIGIDLHRVQREESLVPWARQRGLYRDPGKGLRVSLGWALAETAENVVNYLSERVRFRFDLILPYSADYDAVIAIYNNYDGPTNLLKEEAEAKIIKLLRDVVNDPDQEPMWYFDTQKAFGDRRFPSRRLRRRC